MHFEHEKGCDYDGETDRCGSDLVKGHLLVKISQVIYATFASRLGTALYAVHSVCWEIQNELEYITDGLYDYTVVELNTARSQEDMYVKCKSIAKSTYCTVVAAAYIVGMAMLPFIRGEIELAQCLMLLPLYCTELVALPFHEYLYAYLIAQKETKILEFSGFIAILLRIPIVLASYYGSLGIIGFSLCCTVDYFSRAIYFYWHIRKIRNGCTQIV